MRLIDANALLKKLKQSAEIFLCGRDFKDLTAQDKARVDEIYNCQAEILNAPTIDRPTRSQFKRMAVQLGYEPVIRCQNCAHWQKFNDDLRRDGMCEALLNFHGAERNMTNEDFFCSYGERRADFVDDNKIGERITDEQ